MFGIASAIKSSSFLGACEYRSNYMAYSLRESPLRSRNDTNCQRLDGICQRLNNRWSNPLPLKFASLLKTKVFTEEYPKRR
jgi:hypothetical protein